MSDITNIKGKTGVIMGIANDRSIAWGIASALSKQGANLIFSYPNESIKKRVEPLAEKCNSKDFFLCDVSNENHIKSFFDTISSKFSSIDFLVHSIAFSDKDELKGEYVETSKENFLKTMDISCYSFTSVCKYASKIMTNGGNILTLSYYGAEKVMPHYNVMGIAKSALETSVKYIATDLGKKNIRVNAISAGPMRTLAGAVISNSRKIYNYTIQNSPIKKALTLEDIGKSAVYLTSDLSKGVTGEILYVDNGYNKVGMSVRDL